MKITCPCFLSVKPLNEVQGVKYINLWQVVSVTVEDSEYWGELYPHSEKNAVTLLLSTQNLLNSA